MNLETAIAGAAFIIALAGGSVAVENRYALNSEFNSEIAANSNYHLEQEIRRAQDKLDGLLNIPANVRKPWQVTEIRRLQNLIARLVRELNG